MNVLWSTYIHTRQRANTNRNTRPHRMSVWQKQKKKTTTKTNEEREFAKRVHSKSYSSISHRKSRLNFVYAIGVGKNRKRILNLQTLETRQSTVCCQLFRGYVRKRLTVIWINYFVLKCLLKAFSSQLQIHRVVSPRDGIWLRHSFQQKFSDRVIFHWNVRSLPPKKDVFNNI